MQQDIQITCVWRVLGGGGRGAPIIYHTSHTYNLISRRSFQAYCSRSWTLSSASLASPYYNPISSPKPRKSKSPRRVVSLVCIGLHRGGGRRCYTKPINNFAIFNIDIIGLSITAAWFLWCVALVETVSLKFEKLLEVDNISSWTPEALL